MKMRIKQENKIKIFEDLEKYFRLRLKVNYENCIFRVDEYIDKFLQRGGMIE